MFQKEPKTGHCWFRKYLQKPLFFFPRFRFQCLIMRMKNQVFARYGGIQKQKGQTHLCYLQVFQMCFEFEIIYISVIHLVHWVLSCLNQVSYHLTGFFLASGHSRVLIQPQIGVSFQMWTTPTKWAQKPVIWVMAVRTPLERGRLYTPVKSMYFRSFLGFFGP